MTSYNLYHFMELKSKTGKWNNVIILCCTLFLHTHRHFIHQMMNWNDKFDNRVTNHSLNIQVQIKEFNTQRQGYQADLSHLQLYTETRVSSRSVSPTDVHRDKGIKQICLTYRCTQRQGYQVDLSHLQMYTETRVSSRSVSPTDVHRDKGIK